MAGLARFNNTQPIYTRLTLDALNSNRQISHARASRDLGYQRPLGTCAGYPGLVCAERLSARPTTQESPP
jgi:hypothetical protein